MRRALLPAAAAVLLLAACTNSDDSPAAESTATAPSASASPAEPPAETPEDADDEDDVTAAVMESVSAYSDAFLTGDGATAYGLLSKKCQAAMPLSEFAAITEQAKALYGALPIEDGWTVEQVNARRVRVTYSYAVTALNQEKEPWVLEDGTWRNNEC